MIVVLMVVETLMGVLGSRTRRALCSLNVDRLGCDVRLFCYFIGVHMDDLMERPRSDLLVLLCVQSSLGRIPT